MKKIFLSLLLSVCTILFPVFGQKGDLFISHYSTENEQIENENFAITQDHNGQIFSANRRGVLKFDGVKWNLIKTSTTALSIACDLIGKNLYVGCLDGFGIINSDESGNEQYKPLYDGKDKYISISKIIVLRKSVYFMGDGILFKYDKTAKKIVQKWENNTEYSIQNIFEYLDELYVSDKKFGIFRVENNKINKIKIAFPANEKVVCAVASDNNSTLLFTDNGKTYKYNGYQIRPFKLEDENYLKESIVNDGLYLSKNLGAIATNRGGCLIFNVITGKTLSIANYYSGLPDNEIFAIAKDAQSGIWISHEFGFSRLDYELPLRTYSNYMGLEGHLESAATYNGKLYVATSEGVYYLTETQNTTQIAQYISKSIKRSSENENNKEGKLNETIEKQKEKVENIKRFLGIFKIKNKEKKTEPEGKNTGTQKIVNPKTNTKTVKKIVANPGIGSIKYYFKKIAGIDSKCFQLILVGNKLLVGSNNGIYEIAGNTSKKIISASVSYLYLSRNKKIIFAGTKDDRILSLEVNSKGFFPMQILENYNDDVINICESTENTLWVSSSYYVYKFQLDAKNIISKIDTFVVQNPFSDNINLVYYENKLLAITSSDIYYYDENKNSLIKDTISMVVLTNISGLFILKTTNFG